MVIILPAHRASRLSDEVAHQLGTAIRNGDFAPGARLPSEKELSERFAVSRVVVREAVSQLKSGALVETRQGLGIFVTAEPGKGLFRLDAASSANDELRNVFQLRVAIEGAAAALAAMNATEEEIGRMRQALEDIDVDVSEGRDGAEPDSRFHADVARASRNAYFGRFLAFLGANLRDAITQARTNTRSHHPSYVAIVQQQHRAVLDAICARDPHAAEEAMRLHLSCAMERLGLGPFVPVTT